MPKKSDEVKKGKLKFFPVCPDCGGRMEKKVLEDDEGEPFYARLCNCEVDPYEDEDEEAEEWQL